MVGERWALLVVRELRLGPRRYADLQAALPGLGPVCSRSGYVISRRSAFCAGVRCHRLRQAGPMS
ncbi:winged helix-turn-helix transcriptional regulator [Nonomuraea dietziae]|uniref:winged helix-turn-helix transcriptional regulator n=1 Tax=Nonomuraea dietziae TaxID=65515 RepID=UPI0031D75EF4